MIPNDLTRRHWLRSAGALALAPWASLSLAGTPVATGNRFVLVILRGGMDGLYAVPAIGDPDFAAARGSLGRYASPALPLSGPFALHPALGNLHRMYGQGELAVVHAVGLPYHERSHFDAQQVLESGGAQPYLLKDGWLGRALEAGQGKGLAVTTAVPLVLRGASAVDTWAPSRLPDPSSDLLQRLQGMYGGDPALGAALERARGLRSGNVMADEKSMMAAGKAGAFTELANKAAEFLRQPQGPQVAVLEMGGWDSHADQDAPKGKLSDNLAQLDAGLDALRSALSAPGSGEVWRRTVVVVATEFGRAVEINGTRGTDHGNGGAAFVLGGAVLGGRVLGDWPGLAKAQRFEGRDLRITTDLRSVFKGVLSDHLKIASTAIEAAAFPGSRDARPLQLLRG